MFEVDLDDRLNSAMDRMGYTGLTLVQQKAIPLALAGKDILARARTGSGKTAAYLIPIIQKLLIQSIDAPRALVLVPTKELAEQVSGVVRELTAFCSEKITCLNCTLEHVVGTSVNAHILVSTPSRILHLLSTSKVNVSQVESLVIDEADLILSFGYEDDLKNLLAKLPPMIQSFLMSATLSTDVEELKKLILRDPVTLTLEEAVDESKLFQYYTRVNEEDKFLLMFFILKLRIHPFGSGKSIIFVNSVDRCYKLKLFLEQFGIKTCALNSELPLKSRHHILQEFNRGIYDVMIATDESNQAKGNNGDSDDETETKEKKRKQSDKEFGVSRGIDFRNVRAVISFDLPTSFRSYQHRVGRTARGVGTEGHALSFVQSSESSQEKVLQRILRRNTKAGREVKEFGFDQKAIEGFRYRCQDAIRAVTEASIREARVKEIKAEILNSEKLKAHFEDNPVDQHVLRHDKPIHVVRVQPHLKHLPDYLLNGRKVSKKRAPRVLSSSKKSSDPLKTFKQ